MQKGTPPQIFHRGRVLTIEWAVNARGNCPARDAFDALDEKMQDKFAVLFRRLADSGEIFDETKFKKVTGHDLYEFKRKSARFFGNYRKPGTFVIAHAIDNKKKRRLPPTAIETAKRILSEHDQAGARKGGGRR